MKTEPIIVLKPYQYALCFFAGIWRQVDNILHGRKDAHGFTGNGFDVQVRGIAGEFAFGRFFNLFWDGPGAIRAPDFIDREGNAIEIRTAEKEDGKLRVYDDKKDLANTICVLVIGHGITFRIIGWLRAFQGRLAVPVSNPGNRENGEVHLVPQSLLHDIKDAPFWPKKP